jgi:hypothetical protein
MTIILSFSDTASLSSVMICFTTVVTFATSMLDELEAYNDRPDFWISWCGKCNPCHYNYIYIYTWDQAMSKEDNRKICNTNCDGAFMDLMVR